MSDDFRCGTVALIGRPNVGKSTLVNALVGSKVSIVSPRPQTTRHRLLGIATFPAGQILLLDTPGIHRAQADALHRAMHRAARQSLDEVDALLFIVEAGKFTPEDQDAWNVLRHVSVPIVMVVNKIDRVKEKAELLSYIARVSEICTCTAVHFVSAITGNGLDSLVSDVLRLLPVSPPQHDNDAITDRSMRFLAAELVREQLLRYLADELPYASAVEIENFASSPGLLRIHAVIWVEREGQKPIVIGKQGARLKCISSKARLQMEYVFGEKVFLKTWVRVRAGWTDSSHALKVLGYHE